LISFKQDLTAGVLPVMYIHILTCLACTHCLHVEGDRGTTKKYRKPWAPRSTRKVLVATQEQNWWDAYTETTHQQLLQLVAVKQQR